MVNFKLENIEENRYMKDEKIKVNDPRKKQGVKPYKKSINISQSSPRLNPENEEAN